MTAAQVEPPRPDVGSRPCAHGLHLAVTLQLHRDRRNQIGPRVEPFQVVVEPAQRDLLQARDVAVGQERTARRLGVVADRKSTRLNSSHSQISYAVFCLKKKVQPRMILETMVSIKPGVTLPWPAP